MLMARPVFAYGIDTAGRRNAELAGAPQMLMCDPPALPLSSAEGVLRHVPSPEVMAAWGFDFADVARPSAAVLAEYEQGEPWPSAIELVRAEGEDGGGARDLCRGRAGVRGEPGRGLPQKRPPPPHGRCTCR